MLITILAVGFSSAYYYISINKSLMEKTHADFDNYLSQVNGTLNAKLESINSLALMILSSAPLNNALTQPVQDENTKIVKTISVENNLKQQLLWSDAWIHKMVDSIYIFVDEKEHYSVIRNSTKALTLQKNANIYQKYLQGDPAKKVLTDEENPNYFYIVYNINNLNSLKNIATMVIAFNDSVFGLSNEAKNAYGEILFTVFTRDMDVMSLENYSDIDVSQIKEMFTSQAWSSNKYLDLYNNGSRYLLHIEKLHLYQFYSAAAIPVSEIFAALADMTTWFIVVMVILLSLLLLTGITIATRVAKPLENMVDIISKTGQGNFDLRIARSGFTELDRLADVFNQMSSEISRLINEVYAKKLSEKEAQLQFLQAQMNPHFLFNALECISWKAADTGDETLMEMIWSLGKLLRAGIYLREDEKFTFKEELEYIHFYLYLQKMHFGDKLKVHIDIEDEQILGFYLPKLCLECIVENAVVHGLEAKRGKGIVKLRVKRVGADVVITVKDNGVGFDTDILHLDEDIAATKYDGRTHIGIYNANKRIQLFYGKDYGLKISSAQGKGTEVTITLPTDRGNEYV